MLLLPDMIPISSYSHDLSIGMLNLGRLDIPVDT
jgi:hypothetical protein